MNTHYPLTRSRLTALLILGALLQFACGGSPSVTTPTPPPSGTPADITIAIVGAGGTQSFSPNPASVTPGQTVAFRNNNATTHRIVQDGGAFDTGTLAPGATSAPILIGTATPMLYRCTLHPSMVGGINTLPPGAPGAPNYE